MVFVHLYDYWKYTPISNMDPIQAWSTKIISTQLDDIVTLNGCVCMCVCVGSMCVCVCVCVCVCGGGGGGLIRFDIVNIMVAEVSSTTCVM